MAYDDIQMAAVSEDIKAKLLSSDRDLIKTASLAADDYFRTEIRENGIRRQITPVTQVTDEMLDYAEDTDFPIMFVEIAPRSAGAYKVSFETGPKNEVIHARKSRVEFCRIMTKKYGIDKIRLKGYKMPLLDILYDLMLKDIMDVEDNTTMDVDNTILGNMNENNYDLGCRRWVSGGPIDNRKGLIHLKKAMYKLPGHLQPTKYLMNFSTYCDLGAYDRNEIGGDMAQDMFINGVQLETLQGIKTVVTTKNDLVEDGAVYVYTDPKYYGGFYTYEDVSMVSDTQDDIYLNFFAHETIGASVINAAGVAKVSFGDDEAHALTPWENGD
jgi:hypothetical protein